jgi:hypothetical protein
MTAGTLGSKTREQVTQLAGKSETCRAPNGKAAFVSKHG